MPRSSSAWSCAPMDAVAREVRASGDVIVASRACARSELRDADHAAAGAQETHASARRRTSACELHAATRRRSTRSACGSAPGTSTRAACAGRRPASAARRAGRAAGRRTPRSSASTMRWPPRSTQRTRSASRSALQRLPAARQDQQPPRAGSASSSGSERTSVALNPMRSAKRSRGEELAQARLAGGADPLLARSRGRRSRRNHAIAASTASADQTGRTVILRLSCERACVVAAASCSTSVGGGVRRA